MLCKQLILAFLIFAAVLPKAALAQLPDVEGDDCVNHDPPTGLGFQLASLNNATPGDPGHFNGFRACGFAPQFSDSLAVSQGTVFRYDTGLQLSFGAGELFFGVRRNYDENWDGSTATPSIPVGANWVTSADTRLFAAGDLLVLRDELGRLRFFHPDEDYLTGDVVYYSQLDQGLYAFITRQSTSYYELTFNGGIKYRFAYSDGKIQRMTDRNGRYLLFNYNATTGRLSSITNSVDSRAINFEYISSGTYAGMLYRILENTTVRETYAYSTVSNPFVPSSPWAALSSATRASAATQYQYTTYHTTGGPSDIAQALRMDQVLDGTGTVLVDYQYQGDSQNVNLPRAEIRNTTYVLNDYISSQNGLYSQSYNVLGSSGYTLKSYVENWARDVLTVSHAGTLQESFLYLGTDGTPGNRASQRMIRQRTNNLTGASTTYTYDVITAGVPPYYSGYTTPADHFRQGNCTRIDYSNGTYETFTYGGGILNYATSHRLANGSVVYFAYDEFGNVDKGG